MWMLTFLDVHDSTSTLYDTHRIQKEDEKMGRKSLQKSSVEVLKILINICYFTTKNWISE